MALHFVEQTNRQGFNVYVTVNPAVPSGPHVKDEDICADIFCVMRMLMSGVSSAKSKATSIHKPDAYVCTGTQAF